MLTTETVDRLFSSFENTAVLVIGDVMLDAYVWGSVERISPEAPVPIVTVEKNENRMGGAANVALNLASLEAKPVLCSVVGNDTRGNDFIGLLQKRGMSTAGIIQSNRRKTTTKFRIIGNNTQLLRVDDETTEQLSDDDNSMLKSKIKTILDSNPVKIIIFQDYDKGVISDDLIEYVVDIARNKNIPVAVDPKKKNFFSYKNVTLFKPNLKEIRDGLNMPVSASDITSVEAAVASLQKMLNADMVMNTLSEFGVYVRWKNEEGYETALHPAHIRNIADVSGAGDTVISVAALCLAGGLEPGDMTAIANLAGGLVCEKVGVVPIDKNLLKEEVVKTLTF